MQKPNGRNPKGLTTKTDRAWILRAPELAILVESLAAGQLDEWPDKVEATIHPHLESR